MKIILPDDFNVGTATAAAQIETSGDSNWSKTMAEYYKTVAHDEHREEDLEYIAALGDSYRGGFSWEKLQKSPKAPLEKRLVNEYRKFFGELKDRGVKLMFTLHHFANPMWFEKMGGWPKKESVELFNDYAKKIVDAFGDLADMWVTINEPSVYASMAYLFAYFPPFKIDLLKTYSSLKHFSKVHNEMYDFIKQKYPNSEVGIAKNILKFEGENLIGKGVEVIGNYFYIDYILNLFEKSDFIGVNYYGRLPFIPWPVSETSWPGKLDKMGRKHDDMWEYYPKGLYDVLIKLSKKYPGKKFYITENGTSGPDTLDDDFRIEYIKDHLKWALKAKDSGVNVKGYFHWSTMDNFEWEHKFTKKFGLVYVNTNSENFEREIKKSGKFYENLVLNRSFEY